MSTERASEGAGSRWTLALGACAVLGIAVFFYALFGAGNSLYAWQAFQIGFLYLLGITFAGTLISAIYELTSSQWGQNVKRLAESSVGLIPVVLLAYVGVILGNHELFEAGHGDHELIGGKAWWLESTNLLVRDGLALLLLSTVAIVFIRYQIRPAMGVAVKNGAPIKNNPLVRWITKDYQGYEKELARCTRIRQILAPIMVLLYAIVLSLFAFDQIMGLDPMWISTLFGAYYFITSLFMGWAALSATAVLARQHTGGEWGEAFAVVGRRIRTDDIHDLGKLLFAFCMLSTDFFWSQFVVIWYANIPEETPFIIGRVNTAPWDTIAYSVLLVGYATPFLLLLFKKIKRTNSSLLAISLAILFMMGLERTLLVAPTLWHLGGEHAHGHGSPLPMTIIINIGVAFGFAGIAGMAYRYVVNLFIHAPPEKNLDTSGELREEADHG